MSEPLQGHRRPLSEQALRAYLESVAASGGTVSYREAIAALGIPPPRSVQKLTTALEALMRADADASRALRAAVVVSQQTPALPRPGFFAHARALGRYTGDDEQGEEAARFHARELAALRAELPGTD